MLGFLLVLSNGREAFAGLIIYDFEGSCVSAFGNGCGAFDLIDGDSVSGVFSFEESLVVPGATIQPIGPSTPGVDFTFTFGSLLLPDGIRRPDRDLRGPARRRRGQGAGHGA